MSRPRKRSSFSPSFTKPNGKTALSRKTRVPLASQEKRSGGAQAPFASPPHLYLLVIVSYTLYKRSIRRSALPSTRNDRLVAVIPTDFLSSAHFP